MNGGTDDVDLMGRFYDSALKHFGEPPLIAICDKRVVAPLDRLPEMVDECLEVYPRPNNPRPLARDALRSLYEAMWDGRPAHTWN